VLAHGLAVQAIRARARAGTRSGPAENITACVPAFDHAGNVRSRRDGDARIERGFLGVILEGKYTDGFSGVFGKDAPKFTAEELKVIGAKNDFVGLNIYAPQCYIARPTSAGWSVLPFPPRSRT
jgi:beta-glucosidase